MALRVSTFNSDKVKDLFAREGFNALNGPSRFDMMRDSYNLGQEVV